METIQLKSFDGTPIFAVKNAVASPKAVVVIVHGLAEHSGRYDYVAAKLAESQHSVYRFDNRAHGKSGGPRGDNDDFQKFLKDADLIVDLAGRENKGTPVFMLGHSMGGLIAAGYGAAYGSKLKGQIVSGAAVDYLELFKELEKNYTVAMGRELMQNSLSAAICRDPEVVRAYDEDPLVLKQISYRLLYTTFVQGTAWLHENIRNYNVHCLILHGEDDQLVPVSCAQWLYDHTASQDKAIKVYAQCYHEILNEKEEKDLVIADIVGWIKDRL